MSDLTFMFNVPDRRAESKRKEKKMGIYTTRFTQGLNVKTFLLIRCVFDSSKISTKDGATSNH
ncbi:conserved hypothetical protein [Ricinus communis]|uniref:Uncharacterized protein n=1 Tax=Ricinus communis TaxID=3988 RepID=B9S2E9_RICCO|nr:conserved hypothetical protein [Ricinus communis]